MCSPRPVFAREPGVRGAGTAVLESATAQSTQRPGWTTPSLIGRHKPAGRKLLVLPRGVEFAAWKLGVAGGG